MLAASFHWLLIYDILLRSFFSQAYCVHDVVTSISSFSTEKVTFPFE
jgi:hypothetical protein